MRLGGEVPIPHRASEIARAFFFLSEYSKRASELVNEQIFMLLFVFQCLLRLSSSAFTARLSLQANRLMLGSSHPVFMDHVHGGVGFVAI